MTTNLLKSSVTGLHWLNENAFEIRFSRPRDFVFVPGQKIRIIHQQFSRDYTLLSVVEAYELAICVRHIPEGQLSPLLARVAIGDTLQFTPPFGFFVFQPTPNPVVFVATGTGIAPFVAFAHAGIKGFHLLHGGRSAEALYYREFVAPKASHYIPCLTGSGSDHTPLRGGFSGRVTEYLENHLATENFDFYLCGNGAMIRDAMRIIDRRYSSSRVFTEPFY